jgi:hypothetical protein
VLKQTLLVSAVLSCGSAAWASPPSYQLRVVPPPTGYVSALALVVNGSADFAGAVTTSDGVDHYVFWSASTSTYQDLVGPEGEAVQRIAAISDADVVIGNSDGGAFAWSPTSGWSFILPPAGFSNAVPNGINNTGLVVGTVEAADGSLDGFVWSSSKGMRISPAERQTIAVGINQSGTVAGNALKGAGTYQAFTADKRGERAVGIGSKTSTAEAFAINSSGSVGLRYANSPLDPAQIAISSKHDGLQLSGILSNAFGMTDANDILSFGQLGSFFWNPAYGTVWVSDLIVPNSPVVTDMFLLGVAGNGVLAGQATYQGALNAVVLTPVR